MAEILINAEGVRSCVKYKSGKVCIWLDGVKDIREVPAHGRLGDLDKLYEVATAPYGNLYGFQALINDIKNAPTVIEASK